MNESYDAYCARMADEYAAEAGWTEADLDDEPKREEIEVNYFGLTENQKRIQSIMNAADAEEDDPPPPPPAARVAAPWVGMLAAAEGRRGVDSRASREQRRARAIRLTA